MRRFITSILLFGWAISSAHADEQTVTHALTPQDEQATILLQDAGLVIELVAAGTAGR